MTLPIEELKRRVAAYREHGTERKAAKALGVGKSTFHENMTRAAELGLLGTNPVLPGFAIKSIASKDGDAWVRQTKAAGEVFKTPAGHAVKGVSALVDSEGRTVQQWIKTREDAAAQEAFEKAVHEAFDRHVGYSDLPPAPDLPDASLLTVYPIVDLHLGLFSWGRETGVDYDLKIAADLLRSSVRNLVARSASSTEAIILDLGDYVHADNSRNQTQRSGHPLDVDTRYARVLQIGVELVVNGGVKTGHGAEQKSATMAPA